MDSTASSTRIGGLSPRRAALTAGIAYLLLPAWCAELFIFPRLLVTGDIGQTVQNIAAHQGLFFAGILCHFVTLIFDIIIAWALYVLFAPVNRALSLLTAWMRLVYAAIALSGLMNLVVALRLVATPYLQTVFGDAPLHAQVQLLLSSFRYDFAMALVIFGIQLLLLGYLAYKSRFVPRILGALLALDGLGWVVYCLKPYLYPQAPLDFIPLFGFVELLFPLWLVVRGWKLPDST